MRKETVINERLFDFGHTKRPVWGAKVLGYIREGNLALAVLEDMIEDTKGFLWWKTTFYVPRKWAVFIQFESETSGKVIDWRDQCNASAGAELNYELLRSRHPKERYPQQMQGPSSTWCPEELYGDFIHGECWDDRLSKKYVRPFTFKAIIPASIKEHPDFETNYPLLNDVLQTPINDE